MKPRAAALLLAAAHAAALAQATPEKKNWFNDPFFQVSSGLPMCPVPEGPLLTFDEQRKEAHWRAERGTTCWLSGRCRESNAYKYDAELAPRVEAALKALPPGPPSSVWVTVQRRWVFLHGCVSSQAQAARLEQAARAVPDVEAVVTALSTGTRGPAPYPVAAPQR